MNVYVILKNHIVLYIFWTIGGGGGGHFSDEVKWLHSVS